GPRDREKCETQAGGTERNATASLRALPIGGGFGLLDVPRVAGRRTGDEADTGVVPRKDRGSGNQLAVVGERYQGARGRDHRQLLSSVRRRDTFRNETDWFGGGTL